MEGREVGVIRENSLDGWIDSNGCNETVVQ